MTDYNQITKFTVPIGPQHPALKEPGHFQFDVDGEIVKNASVRLGYTHRGIEKLTESRNWTQNIYLLERICGICSHTHSTTYCLGVEELAGVEIPKRAAAIRVLLLELERVHSHMLWLGVAAHEAGFDTLFMFSWRDREKIMDTLEILTGNRVNYSANLIGGVKFDVSAAQSKAVLDGLNFLEDRNDHYMEIVTQDLMFVQRTRDIGVMTKKQALSLGAVGPTARASGVDIDLRVVDPYLLYKEIPVNVMMTTKGDLESRFIVRINEIAESYRIIRLILENLPEGDLTTKVPRKIAAGESITRIEAPRGEVFYYIRSTGGETPDRVKVRTPTICNMTSVVKSSIGHNLADVPMIMVGIDPCFSCNDRMIQITKEENENVIWNWQQLRKHGIEYYGNK
ncbi:MAG: nickel-dependent hydrogenase large subunit [Anaerolineales bacterium]|nr:nickel-dependent hydrogenase large subunit [Anaerolineales bacterium]